MAGPLTTPTPPAWLDELDLSVDGPPWLAMGLARLDPATWLWPDDQRDAELALRHHLLAERHDEVFAAKRGTEAEGEETLALVRGWFDAFRPDLAASLPADPAGIHPLEAAGRLVQEDLCLMVPSAPFHGDRHYRLVAACLCFPSHWRLADKIGRPAAAIHGPVPHYDPELAARVDRYLDRLRPEAAGWRRNWTVHDSSDLFAPVRADSAPVALGELPSRLWLRSERQTLRRLPRTGAVLFTIRVQQVPFGVLAARPDLAAAMAARLRAQPEELTVMNGLAPHLGSVLAWLDSVAA